MIETQEHTGMGLASPTEADYRTPHAVQGSSSMNKLTSPIEDVKRIERKLRNVILVRGEEKSLGEPLMNDEGINAVLALVESFINRNTTLTHIDEKHVIMVLEFEIESLHKNLMVNSLTWGVREPKNATRSMIVAIVASFGFLCLRRSVNGGERGFWKGSQIEYYTHTPDKEKGPGILGRFFKK